MTDVRILPGEVDRVLARLSRDVDPKDDLRCLAILRDEVKARRLGDPRDYRIQAWDQRRGWLTYRLP